MKHLAFDLHWPSYPPFYQTNNIGLLCAYWHWPTSYSQGGAPSDERNASWYWSRSILERSCHLQLRRHSVMRTTEARISMTPSLVTVWGTVVLPSQTPSRGQLSRRSQDVQMIQRTEAKSLHWEKTSHSCPLFSCHCSPGQTSTWTTSSSMKTRKSHHRCLTRESSDPAQSLMSYNVWLSQNSHLLMMLRWRCWMAQLWFTWFSQLTELTTSNMLCVTSCHSLPTLSQIRHRNSTSFGTSTMITTSKPRFRQNEATRRLYTCTSWLEQVSSKFKKQGAAV